MGRKEANFPVYLSLIGLVQKGFTILDEDSQKEVKEFVSSCQHPDGGFVDRAGHPDLYYSLFGVWLSAAIDLNHTLRNYKSFIDKELNKSSGPVDLFASLLIQVLLFESGFRKPSVIKLLKITFFEGNQTNISYRFFLFFLAVDALYHNRLIRILGFPALTFYSPPPGSPCSVHAAVAVSRQKVGLQTEKQSKILLSYFEDKGFKAFREVREPDMLSTAVALFALKTIGADLRMVTPECLDFIQQNYSAGAFLAGNGDEVRDLEYTFYGLLALGTLA